MMELEGRHRRAMIFVGESDRHGHHPLATEIVHRAHAAGIAGVTVLRGIEGYGASNHVHTTRILSLSDDLPIVIVIVDSSERLDPFLEEVSTIVHEGLITVEDVTVLHYVGRRPTP
jgi:PII-like signaling protein